MELAAVAVVAAAYLLGSVDFGVIIPRLSGADIYAVGSGNPGATNVLRTMGKKMAAFVLLGDLAKGFIAAMAGDLIIGPAAGFAAGFAAVLGHCYPIWHRFKGGKGVATSGGVTFWMEPLLGVILFVAFAGIVAVTKRASVASIVLAASFVPGMLAFGHREWSIVWVAAMSVTMLFRHRGNILRLVRGEEHTIEGSA